MDGLLEELLHDTFRYSRLSILDTDGWIKIRSPVSGDAFKLLFEPIKPSYVVGILFSTDIYIKNGVFKREMFPKSGYQNSRVYCTTLDLTCPGFINLTDYLNNCPPTLKDFSLKVFSLQYYGG